MRPTHRDLYASFASHGVRYVLIGGAAVILHGRERATLDVDIAIEPTLDNATRVLQALRDIGFGTAFLIEADELLKQQVTIFDDRIPIDVHTSPPGLNFDEAWRRCEVMTAAGQPVNVAAAEDLIAMKEAAGRPQDLEDVAWLRRLERGEI